MIWLTNCCCLIMRNPFIDNLRGIAFIMLFIAHTMPNSFWYNIRQFDVPLIVFCSGLAYSNKNVSFSWQWIIKRLKRLYYPILIFLTIFFSASYIFDIYEFSIYDIVASYAMAGGIGYLWIFRIFMYIMVLTPFLLTIKRKIDSAVRLMSLTVVVLIIQETLFWYIGISNPYVRNTLYYAIGYALVFLWGLSSPKISTTIIWGWPILVALMPLFFMYSVDCTSWLGSGERAWYNLEHEKYPPHAYYLIYGIVCSSIIYTTGNISSLFKKRLPFLSFLGQNTCWIYLWHIVFLNVLPKLQIYKETSWQVQFIILLFLATITYFIQYKLVKVLHSRYKFNIFNYLVG